MLVGRFNARSVAPLSRFAISGLEVEDLMPKEDCRLRDVLISPALDLSASLESCSSGEEVSRGSVEKRRDEEIGLFSLVSRAPSIGSGAVRLLSVSRRRLLLMSLLRSVATAFAFLFSTNKAMIVLPELDGWFWESDCCNRDSRRFRCVLMVSGSASTSVPLLLSGLFSTVLVDAGGMSFQSISASVSDLTVSLVEFAFSSR